MRPSRNNQPSKAPKVAPPVPKNTIKEFVALCRRLIHEVFSVEQMIEFPFERVDAAYITDEERLDFMVLYLRRVHGYCFFCGTLAKDERSLANKCSAHLRCGKPLGNNALPDETRQFCTNVSRRAAQVIDNGPSEVKDPHEDEMLVEKKDQYCKIKTREVAVKTGTAFSCKICEKCFKDADFVAKHIKNKHADVLDEKFDDEYFRTVARDNYFQDLGRISFAQTADAPEFNPNERNRNFGEEFGGRNFNRGGNFRGRGGRFGNQRQRFDQFDNHGMERPLEEYKDLDDPMLVTSATSQQSVRQAAAPVVPSTQNRSKANRQLVSYDDLF